jgi:hypothetical protein
MFDRLHRLQAGRLRSQPCQTGRSGAAETVCGRKELLQKGATDCLSSGGLFTAVPDRRCRRGRMGVCEKPPTMDFDLFADLFFIVRPPSRPPPSQPLPVPACPAPAPIPSDGPNPPPSSSRATPAMPQHFFIERPAATLIPPPPIPHSHNEASCPLPSTSSQKSCTDRQRARLSTSLSVPTPPRPTQIHPIEFRMTQSRQPVEAPVRNASCHANRSLRFRQPHSTHTACQPHPLLARLPCPRLAVSATDC